MSFFTRSDLLKAPQTLLRNGRIANAKVYCVTIGGITWTVKDFSDRPWYIRHTIGRFLLRREVSILNRLRGIDGVSQDAFRVDAFAMAVRFVEGQSLHKTPPELVTPDFLSTFEELIERIHERHVVHLDCRGMGNVIYRPDGKPALIDFQSGLYTRFMPQWLRHFLEDLDRSAALKRWNMSHPELMGEERKAELERIEKLRRLWIFQGYFGIEKSQDKKDN